MNQPIHSAAMLTWIVKLRGFFLFVFFATMAIPLAEGGTVAPDALQQRLSSIGQRCGGRVGIAAVHVESGWTVAVSGDQIFPLYSVVKLPLAVAVLKDVEVGKLKLDQGVEVRAADVVPGSPGNSERWEKTPMRTNIRDLLEYSLVDSDNTSCDKLLELIGGPVALTRRIHALGFTNFQAATTMKEMERYRVHPNTGSPEELVQFMCALQRENVLKATERAVLFDMMGRANTGAKRLRAGVPSGTAVLHKTGTGENAVNDVGLITLDHNRGHFAIAVLITNSKLPFAEQEHAVADISSAVYETWIKIK